jgi:hypothetical protein
MKDKINASEKRTNPEEIAGWEQAASNAKRQIEEARMRIASLQRSVRIFEKKIAAGEPWPGSVTPLDQEQLATQN